MILHVDMDAFYASVEERDRPELVGRPVIWQTVATLLDERMPARQLSVRLLGVGVSGLSHAAEVQRGLFDEEDRERQRRLDEVADDIRGKYGSASLKRGLGMLRDHDQES